MDIGTILDRLWADSITKSAIILVLALPLLDLLTGIARAVSNSTFDLGLIDVWVRTKMAGRVIPIVLVLVFGAVIGDISVGSFSVNILTTGALIAAATFIAAEAASILDNVNPKAPTDLPVE